MLAQCGEHQFLLQDCVSLQNSFSPFTSSPSQHLTVNPSSVFTRTWLGYRRSEPLRSQPPRTVAKATPSASVRTSHCSVDLPAAGRDLQLFLIPPRDQIASNKLGGLRPDLWVTLLVTRGLSEIQALTPWEGDKEDKVWSLLLSCSPPD